MDSYAKFISTLAAALATAESPRALKKPRRGQHARKKHRSRQRKHRKKGRK